MKRRALLATLAATIVAVVVLAPIGEWLVSLINWIDANRAIAWPVYFVSYIVATVLMLPGSILTLAAGFIFGLPTGVALVSLSSVTGAVCAFLVGRYLARDWVRDRITALPRFAALDRAAGEDGLVVVALVRLSPLFPFNLTNYGLGLTSVRFRDYLLASWIGMLPGTVLYVYIGSLTVDVTQLVNGDTSSIGAGPWLLGVGFIATVVLTVVITRRATAILRRRLERSQATPAEAPE
ncbi:MAG: TVP38/TMEM64 family protein [Gammaproteobacteria bacterium]|jgi:uncharacterized membrane protein YdjX (TVP38/TMEM64 family)